MVLGPGPAREELWDDEKEIRGERYAGGCARILREERGKLGLVLVLHPHLAGCRSRGATVRAG